MILQIDKIKDSTGINDLKTIEIDKTTYFIASFGMVIRYYKGIEEIHSLNVSFDVFNIFCHNEYYFLIGRKQYAVYCGFKRIGEYFFDYEIKKIQKILFLKNFLIIFYDSNHYILGQIKNTTIELNDSLNDGQYFNVIGSEAFEDKVVILVGTFKKRYLLTYTVENNRLVVNKKDIQGGNAIVKHDLNTILLFNKEGMWKFHEKLTFIKSFGNYKVINSIFDHKNNCTFLFCENREVILLNANFTHQTLVFLNFDVSSAVKIDDIIFCGSLKDTCFINIKNNDFEILKSTGNAYKYALFHDIPKDNLLAGLKSQSEISNIINTFSDQIDKSTLTEIDSLNEKLINIYKLSNSTIRFTGYFSGEWFSIFNFDTFSCINDIILEPVVNASTNFIFTANRVLFCSDSVIKQYNINCTFVKIYQEMALIYSFGFLYILNFNDHKFIYTPLNFDLSDAIINNNIVFCLDFDENLHSINIDTFCEKIISNLIFLQENDNLKPIKQRNLYNVESLLTQLPPILIANGKIFTILDNNPYLLYNTDNYITNMNIFKNNIVISSKNTVLFNVENTHISFLNFESTNSFLINDNIYYCLPNGKIQPFDHEKARFDFNIQNSKYKFYNYKFFSETSADQKSIKYFLNDKSIKFENFIEKFVFPIRKNLYCAGLVNIRSGQHKIVFISTEKDKLKIRKTILLNGIPLCGCVNENNICIVTSVDIILLKLKYGKIKTIKKIENKHHPCKDVQFYTNSTIIITSYDWFYLTVDLILGQVQKLQTDGPWIPLMINGVSGHAINNFIYYSGCKIDCIEDIEYILCDKDSILILTKNGGILQLKIVSFDSHRFIYDTTPRIINNIVI